MSTVRFVVALVILTVSAGAARAQSATTDFATRPLPGLIGSTANALAVHPSVSAVTAGSRAPADSQRPRSSARRAGNEEAARGSGYAAYADDRREVCSVRPRRARHVGQGGEGHRHQPAITS